MLSQLLQRQEATAILMYRESVKDVPISTYGMEEWICSLLASQKKEIIEEIRKECERLITRCAMTCVMCDNQLHVECDCSCHSDSPDLQTIISYLNEALPHGGEEVNIC